MVLIPLASDMFKITDIAVCRGVAVRLAMPTLTGDILKEAIERVLLEPRWVHTTLLAFVKMSALGAFWHQWPETCSGSNLVFLLQTKIVSRQAHECIMRWCMFFFTYKYNLVKLLSLLRWGVLTSRQWSETCSSFGYCWGNPMSQIVVQTRECSNQCWTAILVSRWQIIQLIKLSKKPLGQCFLPTSKIHFAKVKITS